MTCTLGQVRSKPGTGHIRLRVYGDYSSYTYWVKRITPIHGIGWMKGPYAQDVARGNHNFAVVHSGAGAAATATDCWRSGGTRSTSVHAAACGAGSARAEERFYQAEPSEAGRGLECVWQRFVGRTERPPLFYLSQLWNA